MSSLQEALYNKIQVVETSESGLKIFTLLEPIESGDITKFLKHKKIDEFTSPSLEYPVTCFIIGCGNNYFLNFKKLPNCDIDILSIAFSCNGGGHENRAAGRFFNTTYQEVFLKVIKCYKEAVTSIEEKLTRKRVDVITN